MGRIKGTPIVNARGELAPTRCFCNELKAIIDTVTKEMTEKPRNAVRNSTNKAKRKTACDPAMAPAIRTAMDSAMKRIIAKKREDFRYCLKMWLWSQPRDSKYSKTPLFLSYT